MNQRAKQVESDVKQKREPVDYSEHMLAYREYLVNKQADESRYRIAFRIYYDNIQKEIVEALIFGEADYQDVKNILSIPVEAMEVYEHLFFDPTEFITRLDKISYIENYKNKFGKEIKLRALNLGPDFIYFLYGNFIPKTNAQKEVLKKIFFGSAYRTMNLNYNPLGSKISTAATEQAKIMLKAYETLEKYSKEDTGEEHDITHFLTKPSLNAMSKIEIDIPITSDTLQ